MEQKYVCIATSKRNEKLDLYQIILLDKLITFNTHVYDEDTLFSVHAVASYNANILEEMLHSQLCDYESDEYESNDRRYFLPLESIIR